MDRLDRAALQDVVDLSLWAGQLVMQRGADSTRIERTVHRIGTGLGCNWMDILVSPNVIIVTTSSGDEFRTKVRRVVRIGVDFAALAAISKLTHQVMAGQMDRFALRAALQAIDHQPAHYPRGVVVTMVGLACAAFSQLFGGDAPIFFVTWLAASAAMFARQALQRRHFNPFLVVLGTAFVAGLLGSLGTVQDLSETPRVALMASVLLLVPGVPLINAAEDLLEGHVVMGLVRGVNGGLTSLAIAVGLLLAMRLVGVEGL
ncbi:MAG: threonine/serine exporter family protein [Anaerolineae bacterium]|nr:threonine/serine exporter family protein [Anaerolineae bacterium]